MSIELHSLDQALNRAKELAANSDKRIIIGIIGKPGAGKSTLSSHLMKNLPKETTALVPMDGYHLSNLQLKKLGRADRKGAPDTFDASGFVNLLKRISTDTTNDIYFPIFHREIEESIAAEGVVTKETKFVITEGNYLLHNQDGWQEVAPVLTESWYVQVDDKLRLERLVNRHIKYGKEPKFAHDWAHGTDERNAQLVEGTKPRSSVIVHL
jgi:pantothenate kinase